MEGQLLPYLPAAKMAMEISTGMLELLPQLLFFEPGDYTWEDVYYYWPFMPGEPPEPVEPHQTGRWTITLEDGSQPFDKYYEGVNVVWTYVLDCSTDGENYKIAFKITNDYDLTLTYEGLVSFPIILWGEEDDEIIEIPEITYNITISMEDSVLAPSTFQINTEQREAGEGSILPFPVMDGYIEADFQFKKSNDFLKLNGEISLHYNGETDDFFTGTLETTDLKLNGDLRISYVANPYTGIFPSEVSLAGEIRIDDEHADLLEGKFSMEVGNAATYNAMGDYSADNWPNGKLTFRGEIWGDKSNSMAVEFSVEETAFFEGNINIAFAMYEDGKPRQLSVLLDYKGETVVNAEINSTWGPARIEMELTFANGFDNRPTDVNGIVEICGVEVGTISLTQYGLTVEYIDGTYETF
ncbi:MAG: hypothetical protein GX894_06985 [Clostridia bacterium]|nr:hypothetical protein [Clostridia bacterium]